MIKTLSKAQKMEREKFRIPRSVQDAIPIRRIFADGIFQVGNRYSKIWSFTDINYAIAGKEDKTSMFLDYSELLNALDSGASAKITIYNRRINKVEFERSVLLPDRGDGLDEYRHEFNQMLTAQVTGTSNSIVRERYQLLVPFHVRHGSGQFFGPYICPVVFFFQSAATIRPAGPKRRAVPGLLLPVLGSCRPAPAFQLFAHLLLCSRPQAFNVDSHGTAPFVEVLGLCASP